MVLPVLVKTDAHQRRVVLCSTNYVCILMDDNNFNINGKYIVSTLVDIKLYDI